MGMSYVTLTSGSGRSINNTTGYPPSSLPVYANFSDSTVNGTAGGNITGSVINGSGNNTQVKIYVDYNNDGTFGTSAPELVWTSSNYTASALVSVSFTIPGGTAQGAYRMRIAGDFGSSPSGNPCALNYGEIEDYTLAVTAGTADGIAAGILPASIGLGNNTIQLRMVNTTNTTMTSVDIGYKLGSNAAVTQSLSGLSVPAGGVYVATFSTQLNIPANGTYSLKVWLNNVNGGGTVTATNDTACRNNFIVCSALAGAYTIDPAGSGPTNYTTFGAAVTALTNCGVSAPVTFSVASGTYTEQVTLNTVTGASLTNTITFDGGAGNAASRILTFAANVTNNYTLGLNTGNFFRFKNMTIRATDATYGTAVKWFTGSGNDSFQNVIFTGISTTSTGLNLAVLSSNGSANANFIVFDTCVINNGSYGFYNQSSGNTTLGTSSQRITVNNCTITNQFYMGLYYSNVEGAIVTNNRISTNSAYTNYYGIHTYWVTVQADANRTRITGNKISGAVGGYGIYTSYLAVNSSVTTARKPLIANNFVQIGSGANATIGIYEQGTYGADFVHNSVNIGTSQTTNSSAALYLQGATTGSTTVQNNIFSAYNGAPAIRVDNFTSYPTLNFNQYYTSGANFGFLTASAVSSFSNWKTSTSKDANSINVIPTYTSNTDLHISSVCNNGTNLTSLTNVDIDGNSRPTTPDIGADENTSSPSNDVGVAGITAPTNPATAGSQPLRALVKNYGSSAVSSLTVYYTVNGGAVTSELFNFSPSLNQCDTITVTFSSNITIAAGSNAIKVYTAMGGDALIGNDTFQTTICTALSGAYTINPAAAASSTNFQSFTTAVNQMLCGGISGAVTFAVSNGTYTESISLGSIVGNSSTNTISFTGSSPASCILRNNASNNYTVNMAGADYVTFSNIAFTSNTGLSYTIQFLGGSDNNTFTGCTFNVGGSTPNSHVYEQSVVDHFNTFSNNTFNGGVTYSMYMSTNGTRDRKWIISGNTFNGFTQASVYLNFADSINIIDNIINATSSSSYAIYLANAGNSIKILRNNITLGASTSNGISLQSINSGSSTRTIVANNIIRSFVNGSYGLYLNSNSYMDILHNTMYVTGSSLTTSACLYLGSNNNFTLKNNIFHNAAAGYAVVVPAGNSHAAANVVDGNNYFTTGTNIAQISSVNQTTYANMASAWTTAAGGSTQNAASANKVPLFISANTNLNIGDGCITGVSGTGITTDFLGTTRSVSTPNSGAYEYTSLANNLSVVALRSQIAPVSTGLQNVVVTIKNVGNNAISSANIRYKYNGGSAVTTTLGSTLNPCDTIQITFSGANQLNVSSGLSFLQVYTDGPNGTTDANPVNDTIGANLCTGGVSGTFTINSSAPASLTNFTSFASAIATISGCGGISGPVTLNVAAGTYTGQVDLTGISGLSAVNTLTIDGGIGNAATRILQATGNASLPYTIRINNLNYITIRNLTIRGNGSNAWPVHLLGSTACNFNTIKNCIIDFGATSTGSFASTNYQGIVLNGNATSYNTQGNLSTNTIDSNTINGGYSNIWSTMNYGATSSNANVFTGNTCTNSYQYAMYFNNLNGGTIDRNIVSSLATGSGGTTSSYGMYFQNCNALSSANTYSISRNKINNVGQYGMFFTSCSADATSRGSIFNNLIGGGFTSTNANGIYFNGTILNWNIFHNTINLDNANSGGSSACLNMSQCCNFNATTNLQVKNNILAVTNASSTSYCYYMGNGAYYAISNAGAMMNYNWLYRSGSSSSYGYEGGTVLTATSFIGYNGGVGALNSNSITGNPFFISSTDLHINNTGNNLPRLTTPTTDYDGTARPVNTDPGAYEAPTPNNEIRVTALVAPASPFAAGNYTIQATINNNGANTVTSANVSYTINGGGLATTAWTGSLAPGASTNVSIGSPVTFSNGVNYTLVVYSDSPNGTTDAFKGNDTITTTVSPALCGSYTIDQGSPASSTNFVSFTSAVSRLNVSGVSCATTFTVMGATAYTEQVEILNAPGASATNTITFDGGNGNAASRTIQFTSSTLANSHVIRITNSKYVTIRNLTIRANGTNAWPVQLLSTLVDSNININNCIVDFGSTPVTNFNSTNYIGILMNGSATSYTTNGLFTNCNIDSNTIAGGYLSVGLYGSSNVNNSGNIIRNNTITNAFQYGIFAQGINGGTIDRNNITLNTNTTGSYGIAVQNCPNASSAARTWSISGNKMINMGQYGIYLTGTTAFASARGLMANNMIGGGFRSTSAIGIYMPQTSFYNWDIFHNTINLDVANATTSATCIWSNTCCTSGSTTFDIRNNIFAITGASSLARFYTQDNGGYIYFAINNASFNYNLFYHSSATSSTIVASISGTGIPLSSLIGHSGYNANSIIGNPYFISNTNLNIGDGSRNVPRISSVLIDYAGTSRGTSTDIGAQENPGVANDVSISALTPANPNLVAGSNNIVATLKNNGTNTVTSANVSYRVNGGSIVSQAWTGSLAAGATTNVTFSGGSAYTFAANTSYVIKAFSDSPNGTSDAFPPNDTFTSNTLSVPLCGNYTINSSIAPSSTNFTSFNSAVSMLNASGVSCKVTFNVAANTYTEQVNLGAILGTSATNTVNFDGGTGNAATRILTFSSTLSTANYTVNLNGANYVRFKNMTINATNGTWGTAMQYTGNASNDSFFKVTFNGISTTSTSQQYSVITSSTSGSNVSNDIVIDSCTINNGSIGMYNYSSSSSSLGSSSQRTTLSNSTLTNQYYIGIQNQYMDGVVIKGNTITTNSAYTNYNGIYNYWIMVLADANKTIITNNRISGAVGGYGMYNYYLGVNSGGSTPARRYLIANNYIQIGSSANATIGMYNNQDNGVDYIYNSINIGTSQTANTSAAAYFQQGYGSYQNTIQNNIFAAYNGAASIRMDINGMYSTCNYNDLYTTGSTLGYYNTSTACGTIAIWRTNSARDLNSINVAPAFTSNTVLTHNNTSLKFGTPLASLMTLDIDGRPRSVTLPYMGGYERPVPNNMGANLLLSPSLPTSTGTFNVRVNVKNNGGNTITNATIGFKFNGGAAVTTAYTGSLVSLDTTSYNFTTPQITIASGSNTLKIWGVASGDGDNTDDTLTFTFCPGISGNYTINNTIAASSTNFTTFASAIAALNTCGGVSGPIKFTVTGTFNEQVIIPAITNASNTNSITFDGGAGNAASRILTFSANVTNNFTVGLNGARFIRFKNMTINATNTTYGTAMYYYNNASNDSFQNVIFNGINMSSTSQQYAVISSPTSGTNVSNDIVIDTCVINNGSFGMYNYSSSSSSLGSSSQRTTLTRSTLTNQYYMGVYNQYLDGIIINKNIITTNSAFTSYNGINNYWIMCGADANKTSVSGNKISGAVGGIGIYSFYNGVNSSITTARRYLYSNNMIQIGSGANQAVGLSEGNGNGVDYIFNSVNVGTSQSTNASGAAQFTGTAYGSNTIQNNIFSAYNGAPSMRVDNFTYYPTVNYNQYYTAGANFAFIGGSAYSNFNAWKAATITTDANSINVVPSFTSTSDLHISSVCNNGTNLSTLTTIDFDGSTRPSVPDMGADENTTSPANDMQASSIVTPSSPVSAGSQPLKVLVRNNGSASVASLSMSYIFNGGSPVSQTFTFSPALAQCDTATVTFSSNITVGSGANTIKTYTSLAGDAINSNDTLNATFCTSMSGVYTIDASIAASATNFQTFTAVASQLSCGGVSGPVVINVAAGTYTEQVTLGGISGSSLTNTITFDGGAGNAATRILTFNANSTNNYTLSLAGASFVRFKNISINSQNTTYGIALFYTANASSDSFQNVIFNGVTTTSTGQNLAVISTNTSGTNVSSFMVFDTCVINNGAYGVYNYSSSSSSFGASAQRTTYTRNTFTNQYYMGIMNQYVDGVVIKNNTITTNSAYTNYYGLYNYWVMVLADANKTIITGNKISGAVGGYGMYNYYLGVNSGGSTPARRYLVANNFIQIGAGSNSAYGMYNSQDNGVDYVYNTINMTSSLASNASVAAWFQQGYGSYQNTINNNIFTASAGGSAVRLDINSMYTNFNYNNLYSTGAVLGYYNTSTACSTLTTWKSTSSRDANSVSVSPTFTSISDLHIINKSCMDNQGTPVTSLMTVDIDNTTRSVTTPDIGADEYTANTYDVATTLVISPASTSIASATNYTITARVKNFGNTPVTSVVMNYSINGSVTSQTFTPGVAIQPCDSANFSFSVQTMFPAGNTIMKVYNGNINGGNADQDNTNDTVQNTYCTPYTGTYTVNPTLPVSNTNFLTISSFVSSIYNCGIAGNVTVDIADGVYTNQLNFVGKIPGSSPTVGVTFRPASGDTGVWINVTGAHAINLNGAKYITFDGRAGGTGSSRIMNIYTSSVAFSNMVMTNDATCDTIRYCNLFSNNTATGTVSISTTTATTGNDSNTFEYNQFNMSTSTPLSHINASGTAAKENDYITIRNNNFLNVFVSGSANVAGILNLGNDRFWNILNNKFTQTMINLPVGAVTTNVHGIFFNNTTEGGHLVQGNEIGGSISGIAGSIYQIGDATVPNGQLNQVFPIRTNSPSTTLPIYIYGNTIRNISVHINAAGLQSTFAAVLLSVGNAEVGGDGPSKGNMLGDTAVAGSIQVTNYNATGASRVCGIRIINGTVNTKIKNNAIGGLSYTNVAVGASTSAEVLGIQHLSSAINGSTCFIDSNYIGSATITNSIENKSGSNGPALLGGILVTAGGTSHIHYVRSNTINNLYNGYTGVLSTSTSYGIMTGNATSAARFMIDSNTVSNIVSENANTVLGATSAVIGIGLSSSTTQASPEILRNNINNLRANGLNANVIGLFHNNSGANGLISRNRIYALTNTNASNSSASINGIYNSLGGTTSYTNNQIALSNGSNTNDVTINGLYDVSASTLNYYYNSIYVGGTSTSGSNSSFGYRRTSTGVHRFVNNIVYVDRVGGSTNNYSMNISSTTNLTSNYNLLVSSNLTKIGTFSAIDRTFATWKSSTGKDANSWSELSDSVVADSLFTNKNVGNLTINNTTKASWYVNGNGIAGTTSGNIATDYNNTPRGTTLGYGTDIGAHEFTPTVAPPFARQSGAFANNDSLTFTFGGRLIARTKWHASTGATLPTSLNVQYWSGTNPPDPTNNGLNPSAQFMNFYTQFTAVGGSAYEYDATVFYDDALLGSNPSESAMEIAKAPDAGLGAWKVHAASEIDATNNYLRLNGLNSFSSFGASNFTNPLPVQLMNFEVVANDKNADLTWVTASEINNKQFNILRSIGNGAFTKVGMKKAAGNTMNATSYSFTDVDVLSKAKGSPVHYKLEMVDEDDNITLSDVRTIYPTSVMNVSSIYPQPFTGSINVNLNLSTDAFVTISILDLNGKTVYTNSNQYKLGKTIVNLNTAELAAGMYLIRIQNGEEVITSKVFKK